jgi:tetratricopeptide (TPR) repeat protein
MESDRYEEAGALYEEALARPADGLTRARLMMELGELYAHSLNRMAEAEAFAHQAVALLTQAGSEPRVAYCRGAAHALLVSCLAWRNPTAARAAAQQALEWLQPALGRVDELPVDERIWAHTDAASLHSFLGTHVEAITHCELALQEAEARKDRLGCVSVYTEALLAVGRAPEARDVLLDQIRRGASPRALPWLHLALANAQRALQDFTGARGSLLDALDMSRAHPATRDDHRLLMEIWGNLGFVGHQLEQYEEGERAYREALGHSQSLGRHDPGLRLGLGMCQRMRGDLLSARSTLRAALDAGSTSSSSGQDDRFLADAWRTLGEVDHELTRHEEAIHALETALRHLADDDGSRWNAMLWLAASHGAANRVREAERFYRQVLDSPHASDADKASAREGLVSLPRKRWGFRPLVRRAGLYARVLWQHVTFWMQGLPSEYHHARLGWFHFHLEGYQRAIRHLERSEKRRLPTDRRLADHNVYYLGFAHMKVGQYVKAREYLTRSLFFRRDDPHVRDALKWTSERLERVIVDP